MNLPPSLHQTGLPHSVLCTLMILAGGNNLEALRLAELYKVNILKLDRALAAIAAREKSAKAKLSKRNDSGPKARPSDLRKIARSERQRELEAEFLA